MMENETLGYRSWLSLADFSAACEQFDHVRNATHYKIIMSDKTTQLVNREQIDAIVNGPDADRIMFWPIEPDART